MTAPPLVETTTDPDLDVVPPPAPAGYDLMQHRVVARLLRSRWWPQVLQVPAAAVFGLVAYQLLTGPSSAHDNAGTALMWVIWWPLLPILFVVLGRVWCTICPFGWLSDQVQRLVGVERPVPRFLKRYGIWVIDAQFLLITWADHVWGVVASPWGSGMVLLLLTTAVIASGAFLQRRAFCRYLCFLGGLSGNYARTGAVALRADPEICATCTSRAACYNGTDTTPACPLFTFPRTMEDSADCNLCASCIKSCPNDAIQIQVRPPSSELWHLRTPRLEASFLAAAIMGIVLIQNLTMLSVWPDVLDAIGRTTGITASAAVFTMAFAVAVAVPVGLVALASHWAAGRNLESTVVNFARFGFALIPLDIAGHIAHNLFHLLSEGKAAVMTVLGLVGVDGSTTSPGVASTGTIQVLQYALIALGTAASLYAARRMAHGRYRSAARRRSTVLPYAAVIAVLAVLNAWMFALPMAHRI